MENLPNELLLSIIDNLTNIDDIRNCFYVSRNWRNIVFYKLKILKFEMFEIFSQKYKRLEKQFDFFSKENFFVNTFQYTNEIHNNGFFISIKYLYPEKNFNFSITHNKNITFNVNDEKVEMNIFGKKKLGNIEQMLHYFFCLDVCDIEECEFH